jgi:hypothetical protein
MKADELRRLATFITRKPSIANRYDDAAAKLARHILAENPADDDEPVSEEWLRSIGFKEGRPWKDSVTSHLFVQCDLPGRRCLDWCDGRFRLSYMDLSDIYKTRRDVRRLIAALGVEVKHV